MDRIKNGKKNNEKLVLFLIGLALIAVIFGSFFVIFISNNDKSIVSNYITNYMNGLKNINYLNTFKNSMYQNNFINILVWLLGISVIGLPLIIIMYFYKFFILGFELSSFILTYKFKGLFISILYFIPMELFNYLALTIITFFALKLSFNLIYCIFKKKSLSLKKFINKYIYLLIASTVLETLLSLYEIFVIPLIFSHI